MLAFSLEIKEFEPRSQKLTFLIWGPQMTVLEKSSTAAVVFKVSRTICAATFLRDEEVHTS